MTPYKLLWFREVRPQLLASWEIGINLFNNEPIAEPTWDDFVEAQYEHHTNHETKVS